MTKLTISNKTALTAALVLLLVAGLLVQSVIINEKTNRISALNDEKEQIFVQLKNHGENEIRPLEVEPQSQQPVVIYKNRKVKECDRAEVLAGDENDWTDQGAVVANTSNEQIVSSENANKGRVLVSVEVGVGPTDVNIERGNGGIVVKPGTGLLGGVSACYFVGDSYCIGVGAQTNSTLTLKLGKEF